MRSPEREQLERLPAPIDYQILRPSHLPQVHDLLDRSFWPGIDGTPAAPYPLQASPLSVILSERCTAILATTMHGRGYLQAARCRSRIPVLPSRNLHNVPGCACWVGKFAYCNVTLLSSLPAWRLLKHCIQQNATFPSRTQSNKRHSLTRVRQ